MPHVFCFFFLCRVHTVGDGGYLSGPKDPNVFANDCDWPPDKAYNTALLHCAFGAEHDQYDSGTANHFCILVSETHLPKALLCLPSSFIADTEKMLEDEVLQEISTPSKLLVAD